MYSKKIFFIGFDFEREKQKEDFNLICQNIEDVHSLSDINRKTPENLTYKD